MKENKVIVIGHKNPDSDSIISAIAVSFYGQEIFGCPIEARRAGEINNETKFILGFLSKIKLPKRMNKISGEKVVLLDSTEPNQIVDGLKEDKLIAIIDHHNLGGIKTSQPIYVRIEPLGCTCSVVYKILEEKKVKINKEMAFLMIAAIISDTLFFNSPTTTAEDKKIVRELNKIAKVNVKKLAQDMFKAKSSLKGIKEKEIVEKDYKFYQMGKNKIGIGVWETVNPSSLTKKKSSIFTALEKKKDKDKLDYLLFGVVDIIKKNTQLYLISKDEEKLAKEVFKGRIKERAMFLKKIVSRKKQLVPPLMDKLK